jgi:hypothetical protein
MAFNALKHRNVAKVDGMLERSICLVASLAFAVRKASKVDGVLERAGSRVLFDWAR